jgi:hypothetical protein
VSEPSLYPDGYRDPEWDGSEKEFREIVLPARVAAITQGLNDRFADVLPEGMRFERERRGRGAVSDRYAHVRRLEDDAVALIAVAHRQWWRFWLNRKRYQEARRLLAQAGREVDLIAARNRRAAP